MNTEDEGSNLFTGEVAHGEVGWKLELVADVLLAPPEHGGIHCNCKGLVTGSLCSLDEIQSDGSVLKHTRQSECSLTSSVAHGPSFTLYTYN